METTVGIEPKQVRALKGLPVIVMTQWAGDQWLITPVLSTENPRTPSEYMLHSNDWLVANGQMSASVSDEYLLENSELLGEITEQDRLALCYQFFSNMPVDHTMPDDFDMEEFKLRCGQPWPESIAEQSPLWDLVKGDILADQAAFHEVLEPLDPEDGEEIDDSPEALEKEKDMLLDRLHGCIDGADYVGEDDLRERLREAVRLTMWAIQLYERASGREADAEDQTP